MCESDETNHDAFQATLEKACAALRITLTAEQIQTCRRHLELVLEANTRFNLTRITDPVEAAVKHYADSLSLLTWRGAKRHDIQRVLDVGTGAGYPAVPLAVARSDWQITAADSTGKKADFVDQCVTELALPNVHAVKLRIGTDRMDRPPFDLVLFRAVTKLDTCLRGATQWLRPDGYIVCYKSANLPKGEWDGVRPLLDAGHFRLDATCPVTLLCRDQRISHQLLCFQRTDKHAPKARLKSPESKNPRGKKRRTAR